MTHISRRRFLRKAAAGGAIAASAQFRSPLSAYAANEKVNVAVVGSGRGRSLGRWFARLADAHVAVACDVDEGRGKELVESVAEVSGQRPEWMSDFRKMLERNDIDAVVVATPDHWHAPITIHACLAGKDVYVEKPCSHNIIEGRLAVQAARKNNRIVQHGTQLRAVPHYQEAWELLRSGVIGPVRMVKAINNQKRRRIPLRQDEEVPLGVDYDLWLGPAKKRPFNRNRFHSAWHWMWEYGTGDLGNDGVHQIDLGRWALGLKAPNAVSCSGAKLGSKGDAQETPDTMVVTWEYEDLLYVFEQRDFTPYRMQGHRLDNDNIFFGDKGYMMVDRDGYRVFFGDEPGPSAGKVWRDSTRHYQNFIDCVKNRRTEDLIADIEEAHYSSLLCHLGNIAYRTGRRLLFDGESESFLNDDEANGYLGREYRKGFELPLI